MHQASYVTNGPTQLMLPLVRCDESFCRVVPALTMYRCQADAQKALDQMNGTVLGSRRIYCAWACHKQETPSARNAAVDQVSCPPCC